MAHFAVKYYSWSLMSIIIVSGSIFISSCSEEAITSRQRRSILFSELLSELYGYETEWHRCMYLANYNQCLTFKTGTQTHLHYSFIVEALNSRCRSTGLYECMTSDPFLAQLVDIINEDIAKTVSDVCCLLKDCIDVGLSSSGDITARGPAGQQLRSTYEGRDAEMTSSLEERQEMLQGFCRNCSMLKTRAGMDESLIDKAQRLLRLEVLYNMTCTEKTVAKLSCKQLNAIAINILSSSVSSMELLDGAKNILKQCNPGFYHNPSRTFSALFVSFSDEELNEIKTVFAENITTMVNPPTKNQPGLGKVIGMIVFVAIVTACIGVVVWSYWIKPIRRQVKMNTQPQVNYTALHPESVKLEEKGGTAYIQK